MDDGDLENGVIAGRIVITHYLLATGEQAYSVQTGDGINQLEALGLIELAKSRLIVGKTSLLEDDDD